MKTKKQLEPKRIMLGEFELSRAFIEIDFLKLENRELRRLLKKNSANATLRKEISKTQKESNVEQTTNQHSTSVQPPLELNEETLTILIPAVEMYVRKLHATRDEFDFIADGKSLTQEFLDSITKESWKAQKHLNLLKKAYSQLPDSEKKQKSLI